MASSASSSTIASPATNNSRYDVFISFRGEDTRFSFTDHLYEALVGAGIRTFRDDDSTNSAADLKPEIERAITASRASIVVLSKNYANSTLCLDELVLIMERRKTFYHIVIPVFYHVDPSHVREQENSFSLKVNTDVEGFQMKVERWKAALTEVANLEGKVLTGPETKFIADIVSTIGHKLRLKLVSTPPHLTGMDTRAEAINFWVKDKQDAEVLTICGMAGSGKTTLAKYIYESNLLKFESSSFLEDIGKICEQPYGLCALQEQLLADILEEKKKELDVTRYKSQIENVLQKKRVLIVLDDIDKKEQLEALLGSEKINTESKIIITSRLPTIQTWFMSTYLKCKEHKLELLNEHESLELLSWYAFGSKIPMEGFKELASQAAEYCSGNPLALKLLGSLFVNSKDPRKRNNIDFWISTLNLLERDPDYRIQGILRMSYEYLPFLTYRELFLHIACFFIGEDEDYVVKILEPDYCATAGIPEAFEADSLAKMDNLKLLQLNYVELSGSYDDFPEDLRWLCWHGFQLGTIPSDFFMGNLVAIDMSYSRLQLFEPPMVIKPLKILNFKDSHSLLKICNISRLPNLETLILWNCYSLVHVCDTIEDLKSLSLLNMTGCEHLLKGSNLKFPHSLERIWLKNCNIDFELSDYSILSFQIHSMLQYLHLGNNLFEFLPDYNHLKSLRVLELSFCSRLKRIECLPNTLEELFTTCCELLENISFQSHRFALREFDYEGCINLLEVEGLLKLVPILRIDERDLGHMKWLKDYQDLEVSLIGDYQLTSGRSHHIQMLYEFGITSTFLPNITNPNITHDYISQSSSLSFTIPPSPKTLKGLNITFKYTITEEKHQHNQPIFAKITNTTKGLDLIYNPMVFGKPKFNEVAVWLSYWSMGNLLDIGDKVNVCFIVENGLEVHECGAKLVYANEDDDMENNMEWEESLLGDLSRFKLSTDTYYLCRRDFFKSMEVDGPTPSWFRDSVGYKIDYTEIQGWRKTGRSQKP
ncbi:unnamed protein product [Lactuca saligna]|uniref:TIR domain-containing protein n=1 Tax=Lactuca saligna TaxID=75948 RepID=A0AA35ZIW7_LACSI|nr:unnamed protein product [Lactuca saligna]